MEYPLYSVKWMNALNATGRLDSSAGKELYFVSFHLHTYCHTTRLIYQVFNYMGPQFVFTFLTTWKAMFQLWCVSRVSTERMLEVYNNGEMPDGVIMSLRFRVPIWKCFLSLCWWNSEDVLAGFLSVSSFSSAPSFTCPWRDRPHLRFHGGSASSLPWACVSRPL